MSALHVRAVATLGLLWLAAAGPALSNLPLDHAVTDGTVLTTALDGDRLYIGGLFEYVGPVTGGAGLLDPVSGALDASFPVIDGYVSAVAEDGSGGWYLGGTFTSVGGALRQNLAHVTGAGSVSAFNPGASSSVLALALSGDTLFVGGFFTGLGGGTRLRIGALDADDGSLLAWDPAASGNVRALNVRGDVVYAGGEFTNVGGAARNYLAAIDRATGAATAWNPNPSFLVWTLARSGSTLYLGGNFTMIGGQSIKHAAAVDAISGAVVATFAPQPNAPVHSIAIDGGTVYLGGLFQLIGATTRKSLAAVLAGSGSLTAWQPSLTPDFSTVDAMILSGPTLYIGGSFRSAGGQARDRLAAINTTDAQATSWDPPANGNVSCLALAGGRILTGGTFTSVTGVRRENVAALDLADGQPAAWNPGADDSVRVLVVDGSTIYLGGSFENCGGQPRSRLAAVSSAGVVDTWNPGADGPVNALVISGDRVFAGGEFSLLAGAVRTSLGAVHRSSGAARPWSPVLTNIFATPVVNTMILMSDTLIVGGSLFTAGFQGGIAAFDTTQNADLGWGPGTGPTVDVMLRVDDVIYVGGNLNAFGGGPSYGLNAFDARTGLVLPFAPAVGIMPFFSGRISGLEVIGNRLYAGGIFDNVDGTSRASLAAFELPSHALADWNPGAGGGDVRTLRRCGSLLIAGGSFTLADGKSRRGLAVLEDPAVSGVPGDVVRRPFRLASVQPNPTRGPVELILEAEEFGPIRVDLFDVSGRLVRPRLIEETVATGNHRHRTDLSGVRPGVYFLRATDGSAVSSRPVVVAGR